MIRTYARDLVQVEENGHKIWLKPSTIERPCICDSILGNPACPSHGKKIPSGSEEICVVKPSTSTSNAVNSTTNQQEKQQ